MGDEGDAPRLSVLRYLNGRSFGILQYMDGIFWSTEEKTCTSKTAVLGRLMGMACNVKSC